MAERHEPRPRGSWVLSAAALLAVAAALTAFGVILDEGLWGPSTIAVCAAAIAAAGLVRTRVRRWAPLWSAIGAGLGALLALTLLFAADTAFLGVVPLPATAQRFVELIGAGEISIAEQSIAAAADDGIRFVMASGIAALAIMVDGVLVHGRRPAVIAVPLLAILSVPVVLAPGALPVLAVLATAGAYLLALALHRPAASGGAAAAGRAVAVGAGVLVAALLIPPLLPPVIAGSALPGGGVAGLVTGVNPVLDLGDDLRRDTPVEALRYTTDADGGVYLTLSHLADYAGPTMQPVLDGGTTSNDRIGPPSWLGDEVATGTVRTSIQLQNVRSRWVPLPAAPVTVTGLEGQWLVNPDGITVGTVEGTFRGGAYEVESLLAQPTPEQLRAAGVAAPDLDRFRALPDELDPLVVDTARAVADSAAGPSPYDQALALQRFFTGGDFVYSEEAPVELGYDGTGADIVAVFLQERAGYCVHYAAAMTLMARTLGIPARIAVGFLPGTRNPDVPSEYIVSTDDLHAWPELHFDGIGWVRFEPTPSRGATPAYADDTVPAPGEEPVVDPETGETIAPTPDPSTGPSARPDDVDPRPSGSPLDPSDLIDGGNDSSGDGEALGPVSSGTDARPLAAALLGLLVLALFSPALWRVLRRAARRRSPDALDQWRELRDTARDLGLPAADTRTPRELAAAWGATWTADQVGALDAVRVALEARAFAAPTARALVDAGAVDTVLGALRGAVPRWRRVLAVLVPVSLLDRAPDDAPLPAPPLAT